MKKTYVGRRLEEGCEVYVKTDDGRQYPLSPCNAIRNHSPDGFEWGYNGSGPAQLALAILADHCGPLTAPEKCPFCESPMKNDKCPECLYDWKEEGQWSHIVSGSHGYQGFKFQVVAKLPHEGFNLSSEDVAAWVITKSAQKLSSESQLKLAALDESFTDGSGLIALSLLRQVHAHFPLEKAGMGEHFNSTHTLHINADGKLVLDLWWEGHCWPITFELGDPETAERK